MDAVANLDVIVSKEEDFLDVEKLTAEDLSAYENTGLADEWRPYEPSTEPFFVTSNHSDWQDDDPRLYDRKFWVSMNDVFDIGQPIDRIESIKRDSYHASLPRSQPLPGASSRRIPNYSEASGETLEPMPSSYGIKSQFSSEMLKAYLQRGLYPFIDGNGIFRIGKIMIKSKQEPDLSEQASCSKGSNSNHVGILESQPSAIFRRAAQSHKRMQLQLPFLSNEEPSTSSNKIHNNLTILQTSMVVTRTPGSTQKVSHDGKIHVKPKRVFKIFKPGSQMQDNMRIPLLIKNKLPVIDIADSDSESDSESESESEIDVVGSSESSPEALHHSKQTKKRKLSNESSDSKLEKKNFLRKNSTKLRI